MSNFSASDTRSLALDHIEAVKAAADTDGLSSIVEVGLRLAEVYALLAIGDALVDVVLDADAEGRGRVRLLVGGGADYSGLRDVVSDTHGNARGVVVGGEEVPC